jgi:hypothetical protein
MKNKYYFVARYWNDDDNQLNTYTFGSQLQYGTEENAEGFLKYVKEQCPDKDGWQIFWVNTDRDERETPEEIRERLKEEYIKFMDESYDNFTKRMNSI